METRRLKVIPRPANNTRSIIVLDKGKKIKGENGSIDLVCGDCEEVLAEKINEGQIFNVVLKCSCGAYNEMPKLDT